MASEELQKVLGILLSRPAEPNLTLPERRAVSEATPRFPLADDVRCERIDANGVPAEWVVAPGADEGRAIYYLHGGGYAICSVNTHREMISRLSRAAAARALAIDYRLAPEHPFPAAVEDSVTGYRWLLSTGVRPARVAIAGDSAGGGLTVATLVALRDAGDPLPAAGICISPWVDLEGLGESMTSRAEADPTVQREGIVEMGQAYLGGADPHSALAAPIYADLSGLPPLLIQVGTAETLLDDANRLEDRARKDGVDVTLELWEDMFHVWHSFAPVLPEAQKAVDRIGEFIRGHAV